LAITKAKGAEDGKSAKRKCSPMPAWLKRGCDLESGEDHCKFRALVREILKDWDALGVFVKNSQHPQL
jgi:hypothetical protein